MLYLLVGMSGCIGALCRFLLGRWVTDVTFSLFPFSTFSINLIGCFILSFFYTVTVARIPVSHTVRTAIGTGFIGSFTTFSTFSYETLQLLEHSHYGLAVSYVIGSLFGGIACAWFGIYLGRCVAEGNVQKERRTNE
jgi:CrcB protein